MRLNDKCPICDDEESISYNNFLGEVYCTSCFCLISQKGELKGVAVSCWSPMNVRRECDTVTVETLKTIIEVPADTQVRDFHNKDILPRLFSDFLNDNEEMDKKGLLKAIDLINVRTPMALERAREAIKELEGEDFFENKNNEHGFLLTLERYQDDRNDEKSFEVGFFFNYSMSHPLSIRSNGTIHFKRTFLPDQKTIDKAKELGFLVF